MASPKIILKFAGATEYAKQMARGIAKNVAGQVDIKELLTDREAFMQDLMDAVAIGIDPQIEMLIKQTGAMMKSVGLDSLTPAEIDAIKASVIDNLHADGMTALSSAVNKIAGMSETAITVNAGTKAGTEALLAPITSILSSTAGGIVNEVAKEMMSEAVSKTADSMQTDGTKEPLFRWITVGDNDVCSDVYENSCDPRHGDELTMEEWGALGEPGDDNLLCSIYAKAGSNCRCILEPADNANETPDPVDVTDAISEAKDAADKALNG